MKIIYNGDLVITKENQNDYKEVEIVDGILYITRNVNFETLKLKEVKGIIILGQKATLSAPNLFPERGIN